MPLQSVHNQDGFEALVELDENYGHAAIVDYPWQFQAENGTGRFGEGSVKDFTAYGTEDHARLATVLDELQTSLVDGAWVFVFADDDTVMEFRELVEDSPLTYRRTLVWDRKKFGMGTYHRVQHYPIISATNGETERYVKDRGTVFQAFKDDGESAHNNDYPTGKPVKLYREMLAPPVLRQDETLLEPFCGAGPGAKVAMERKLGYWGVDTNDTAVREVNDTLSQTRLF
jgi:DNA modification methylase